VCKDLRRKSGNKWGLSVMWGIGKRGGGIGLFEVSYHPGVPLEIETSLIHSYSVPYVSYWRRTVIFGATVLCGTQSYILRPLSSTLRQAVAVFRWNGQSHWICPYRTTRKGTEKYSCSHIFNNSTVTKWQSFY